MIAHRRLHVRDLPDLIRVSIDLNVTKLSFDPPDWISSPLEASLFYSAPQHVSLIKYYSVIDEKTLHPEYAQYVRTLDHCLLRSSDGISAELRPFHLLEYRREEE